MHIGYANIIDFLYLELGNLYGDQGTAGFPLPGDPEQDFAREAERAKCRLEWGSGPPAQAQAPNGESNSLVTCSRNSELTCN